MRTRALLGAGKARRRSGLSNDPLRVSSPCPSIFDFVHLQSSPTRAARPAIAACAIRHTPPTVEEIIAVMRAAGEDREGVRLRGLIVVLWRAGLRISEELGAGRKRP